MPEMLIPALQELEDSYSSLKETPSFQNELKETLQNYAGRPSPLYYAENLTDSIGGADIFLKNEGLNHTGAHKINNAVGQALLAGKMGKKTLVAETGAGQHGLATATVAAKFGFKCIVFMGEVDIKRQFPNVYSMKLLGAEVVPVKDGTATLKDAVNAAFKYWAENLGDCYYLLGSALGPFPYPLIVRDFQSVIGKEIKTQIKDIYGREKPDCLVACVGGGSNSIGTFYPFIEDDDVKLVGVEAGGRGPDYGNNAVRFGKDPAVGIAQGYKSYFIQDKDGRIAPTHSISAGLDYAGIGPELAYLKDSKRVQFVSADDQEVLYAFKKLAYSEGIFPALESSHAVAEGMKRAADMKKGESVVVTVSGRGDKDIFITAPLLAGEEFRDYLNGGLEDGSF